MAPLYRIDPRIRALGKARLDVTRRARDEQEWQRLWRAPRYPFPFAWGEDGRFCLEYLVDDFAAEIGFLIDVLGFPVSAFSTTYAQFTSPDQAFFFAVRAVPEGFESTPPNSIRLQFRLSNLAEAVAELERRGVIFEVKPEPGGMNLAVFRSPHGVPIELWPARGASSAVSEVAEPQTPAEMPSQAGTWSPSQGGGRVEPAEESPDEDDLSQAGENLEEPIYVDDEESPHAGRPGSKSAAAPRFDPTLPGLGRVGRPAVSPPESAAPPQKPGKGNGMRPFPTRDEGEP